MLTRKLTILFCGMLGIFTLFVPALAQNRMIENRISPISEDPIRHWQHYAPPPMIMDIAFEGTYIWAATPNGVLRWNRSDHTFTMYTTAHGLADNNVLSVAVDGLGNKWFGTFGGGISRLNSGGWQTFNTSTNPTLLSNIIPTIAIHPTNGTVLLGTSNGVNLFDGVTLSALPFTPQKWITTIAVDNSQRIWIGTNDAGTYRYSGNSWKIYGDPNTGPGGRVRDITVAPSGDIWFAFDSSFNGSVGRFSGDNWTRYTTAQGLVSDYAQGIDVDANGVVWAAFTGGPAGSGVSRFNGTNWIPVNLNQEVGYFPNGVNELRADDSGKIWFVSEQYLFTFDGNDWDILLTGLPIPPSLGSPRIGFGPNNDVWFSVMRTGVVKYDGYTWRMFTQADGLAGTDIQAITADDAQNVWFAVWQQEFDTVGKGVNRFDGHSWTTYTTANGLANDRVYDIAVDASGNTWFGTIDGLSKFSGTSWTTYTTVNGLRSNRVEVVATHGNDIWIGYFEPYGVSHFNGSSWVTFDESTGLANGRIYGIDFDSSGNTWVATAAGVSRLDDNVWTNYPLPDGASLGWVTDMAIDNADNVWIGANGNSWTGLSRLTGGSWTSYTTANGLLSDEIDDIAIDGNFIWFSQADQGVGRLTQLYGLDKKVYLSLVQR